jgi:hypothetical protein
VDDTESGVFTEVDSGTLSSVSYSDEDELSG